MEEKLVGFQSLNKRTESVSTSFRRKIFLEKVRKSSFGETFRASFPINILVADGINNLSQISLRPFRLGLNDPVNIIVKGRQVFLNKFLNFAQPIIESQVYIILKRVKYFPPFLMQVFFLQLRRISILIESFKEIIRHPIFLLIDIFH